MLNTINTIRRFFASTPAASPLLAGVRIIPVSEVERATQALPCADADEMFRQFAGSGFEAAYDLTRPLVNLPQGAICQHPFVTAAHYSFAEHRPLVISPDMIWLLLAQMCTRHILQHPQESRQLLVSFTEGKRTLTVIRDNFVKGSSDNDWRSVFAEFEEQILAGGADPLFRDFSHPFSGSTPDSIAARQVTLMKAASPFYLFEVLTRCGIPEIHLEGSVEEWRWIRQKAEGLTKLGLHRQIKVLLPVLDRIIDSAEGLADAEFWQSFYKYRSKSGGEDITGWIMLFFLDESSPQLDIISGTDFSWSQRKKSSHQPFPASLRFMDFLRGDVEQEFVWKYLGTPLPMSFQAGFMGVSQDPHSLALRPEIGWLVAHCQESPDQKALRHYLASFKKLTAYDAIELMCYLEDLPDGSFRVRPEFAPRDFDAQGFEKVLPLMTELESVSLGSQSLQTPGICRLLLQLPRLKTVIYDGASLSPECLRILRDRQDWQLQALKD